MKPMHQITNAKEQQAIVDGFAEFFIRHTGNPLLALIYIMLQLEKIAEWVFVVTSAITALLVLFSSVAQAVVPHWVGLLFTTAVLLVCKKLLYRLGFRLIRSYAGVRNVEAYFAAWGKLNDKLKQRIDQFDRTGKACPDPMPSETYDAYKQWYQQTGRQGMVYVSLALAVPAALALAGWYILLPAGLLMILYQAPFFATVYWGAMAVACIGTLLVMGLARLMQYQMQRHPAS